MKNQIKIPKTNRPIDEEALLRKLHKLKIKLNREEANKK